MFTCYAGYFSRESMLIKAQIPKILQELTNETIQATGKLSGLYWKEDPAQYRKGKKRMTKNSCSVSHK